MGIENNNLIKSLKQDYSNNSKKSFIILFFYLTMHICYENKRRVYLALLSLLKYFVFLLLRIDAQISYEAQIGDDIRLPHSGNGVVISSDAIIEDHQTIYHQVTIGINEKFPKEDRKVIIRKNCYLSVGCKIINCEISEGCKIGPNAVAYRDLAPNTTLVCNCMEIKRKKE